MKVIYKVTSEATGIVLLKRRKIAKALRWWLRMNGHQYEHGFFLRDRDPLVKMPGNQIRQQNTTVFLNKNR